jgi:hypothetical protein
MINIQGHMKLGSFDVKTSSRGRRRADTTLRQEDDWYNPSCTGIGTVGFPDAGFVCSCKSSRAHRLAAGGGHLSSTARWPDSRGRHRSCLRLG